MYQLKNMNDTIAAISTPSGVGGIGIIRISGEKAVSIADQIFEMPSKQKVSDQKTYTVHHGWIKSGDNLLDEVLLTIMRGPKSYTTEDVVEISCHGGTVSLKTILELCLSQGARLAEPGEFTKRAYLNGRIDLAQAEAVLDIIQAKSDAFLKVSSNQLKGELSKELESIREILMNIYVEIEAFVNFPEDEIDDAGINKLSENIQQANGKVKALLSSSDQGLILKDGIKIVLCGRANVGKSSLLNTFLKQPRAIVSDIAGTTRDTIEETATIQGVPLRLVDTAGILEPKDLIEEEAIKRSRMNIDGADLTLFVFDASEKLTQEDRQIMGTINGHNTLVVLNKCDLKQNIEEKEIKKRFPDEDIVKVSATQKTAIDGLEKMIVVNALKGKAPNVHGILVNNIRHIQALKDCQESLLRANVGLEDRLSLEFISEEIKTAVNFLDQITGRDVDGDLIDTIFSQFCIGK